MKLNARGVLNEHLVVNINPCTIVHVCNVLFDYLISCSHLDQRSIDHVTTSGYFCPRVSTTVTSS